MSLFSKQDVYCMYCGVLHATDFLVYGGEACSPTCWEQIEWRRTLSIMGKAYYPKPTPPPKSKEPIKP